MGQSKMMSLVEAATNTGLGLVIAVAVNAVMMSATGVHATLTQNIVIVFGHTVVSVLRSYVVRRLFNGDYKLLFMRAPQLTNGRSVSCMGASAFCVGLIGNGNPGAVSPGITKVRGLLSW